MTGGTPRVFAIYLSRAELGMIVSLLTNSLITVGDSTYEIVANEDKTSTGILLGRLLDALLVQSETEGRSDAKD